jgi:small subunit ribosomal protein S20
LANIKSSIKQIRQDIKKTARNKPVISSLKTYVRNTVQAVAAGDKESSAEALRVAYSKLDKAAEKGIIHRNQAARRKARLAARFKGKFDEVK